MRIFKSIPGCMQTLILWFSFQLFFFFKKTFAIIVINNWYLNDIDQKFTPEQL